MANEKVFNLPNNKPTTQKELAESYGITKQTMNNYMRMADMIPELEDLVDTGIVTKDTALVYESLQFRELRSPKSTDHFMKKKLKRIKVKQVKNMEMVGQSLRQIYHKL